MPQSHEDAKKHKKFFNPITPLVEEIAKKVVNSAYDVHINLGPGLPEKVYETCFCHEL